jgi:hypothetical protein
MPGRFFAVALFVASSIPVTVRTGSDKTNAGCSPPAGDLCTSEMEE